MNTGGILATLKGNLRSAFLRNMFVLMSGTAAAQVISIAFIPVLTRFYDPSAFGVFGVYMSLVLIVTSICTLGYDQALMLPRKPHDSAILFRVSCLSVGAIAILSAGVCIPARKLLAALMDSPDLAPWVCLIPVTVFLSGACLSLSAWSTRQKQFRPAAASQVVRSATTSGSQCAAGIIHGSPFGLILGSIVGQACASLVLATQLGRGNRTAIKRPLEMGRMRKLAREYADFPLYASTQALFNSLSRNLPVLLLAHFFGMTVAGFYALGVRTLQLPMNLLLASLRQVLFQKASEVHNSGGNTHALFVKVTLGLLAIAIVPILILLVFAPAIFSLVLGNEWHTAGEYARWLALWLGVLFANVPAVLLARIYRKQRALWLQGTSLLICRAGALVIGGLYFSALETIILYSIVGLVFNVYIIVWMWSFLRNVNMEASRCAS